MYDDRHVESCGEIQSPDMTNRLVGVAADKGNASVIITYPHVIERYKLSKITPFITKVGEWRTKYNLTSAVIYDATSDRYVGVFHECTVRVWSHDTSDLERTAKYKFRIPIHCILTRIGKCPVVIFRNGDCVTLPYGLEHCATFSRRALIKQSLEICDLAPYTKSGTDYVCYVLKDSGNSYSIVSYQIKDEMCDNTKVNSVNVSRQETPEARVTGQKIFLVSATSPVVHFTWNDSCISKYDVIKQSWTLRHRRYAGRAFRTDISLADIGKNYFFIYEKDCADPTRGSMYSAHATTEAWCYQGNKSYRKKVTVKLYHIDNFLLVVDVSKITVWDTTLKENPRAPEWSESCVQIGLNQLTKPSDYLPIFGFSELSAWKRTSVYRKIPQR